jgi:hypothetical protein
MMTVWVTAHLPEKRGRQVREGPREERFPHTSRGGDVPAFVSALSKWTRSTYVLDVSPGRGAVGVGSSVGPDVDSVVGVRASASVVTVVASCAAVSPRVSVESPLTRELEFFPCAIASLLSRGVDRPF